MRRNLILAALVSVAAILPATAGEGRHSRNNRGYGYGAYGGGAYGDGYGRGPNLGGNPVRAAMRDLEMIFRRARVDRHEANHFRRALDELAQFDRRAMQGRFDQSSLNAALRNMADLAQADQLHPRDRQIIRMRMDGLYRMRDASWRY